jgi:hypothetical protein
MYCVCRVVKPKVFRMMDMNYRIIRSEAVISAVVRR